MSGQPTQKPQAGSEDEATLLLDSGNSFSVPVAADEATVLLEPSSPSIPSPRSGDLFADAFAKEEATMLLDGAAAAHLSAVEKAERAETELAQAVAQQPTPALDDDSTLPSTSLTHGSLHAANRSAGSSRSRTAHSLAVPAAAAPARSSAAAAAAAAQVAVPPRARERSNANVPRDHTHTHTLGRVPGAHAKPRAAAPSGGLFGPLARKLIDRGALAERDALALALRARDQGLTFFHTMALDASAAANQALYGALAELTGAKLVTSKRELMDMIADADWLTPKAAEQRGVVLLKREDGAAAQPYGTVDPTDLLVRDWLRTQVKGDVAPVLVQPAIFFDVVNGLKNRADAPKRGGDENLVPIDVSWQQESLVLDQPRNADIPLVVDYILQKCHEAGASDIHLEPTEEGMICRARIDGILQEQSRMPLDIHSAVVSRIKILAGMDVAERRRPQDGRITVMIRKSAIDVRVSTLPTVLGEKVVMRLLDDQALRPSPELLGMRDQNLRLVLDKITAPHGLILISGPTGSGKTTTLYSFLSAADRAKRNVVTIEDPVEYRLSGVHQMQVNEKIGLNFAAGLRTVLRQDPDIIMVGECRDVETSRMAVQAALTGHVVFSTIHANDCISVVTRLLDMKIDSFLVASALTLSISQRLVRVTCKHCAVMVEGREILRRLRAEGVSSEKMERLGIVVDDKLPCVQPTGCAHCRHTGYTGRQAVFEMLEINSEIRKLIVSDHFDIDSLRRLASQFGMTPMIANGLQLVEEGRTTYSELIRVFGDG